MKKLFYILAAVATLSMTSCSDLLDEANYGNPTVEDMMSSEENAVLMFGQCYADLKWVHDHWGYWGVSSLTADECLCPVRKPGDHWADGGYWKNLNVHTWNEFAECFRNIWNSTITGAVNCNKMINTFEQYKSESDISDKSYKMFVSELEVLRCYYYYLLFDCFGRIPYVEAYETKNEELLEPQLVWSYLVSCLERNAPDMAVVNGGNRQTYLGRVTQGFAYGLLARLYLNAESFGCTLDNVFPENIFVKEIPALKEGATAAEKEAWEKEHGHKRLLPALWDKSSFYANCIRCCDEVIKSGSYTIEEDYFTNFLIDNSVSRENMFVLVEDGRADFDNRSNGSMSNKMRIILLSLHYSHQESWGMIEKPWNGFCARPEFMKLYKEDDVRGAGNEGNGTKDVHKWGWFVGPIYNDKGELLKDENKDDAIVRVEVEGVETAKWGDGARMQKYEVDKTGTYAYSENDFVLMRYADVLWMKREAAKRGNVAFEAVGGEANDFNKLLARTFNYTDGDSAAKVARFHEMYGDPNGWDVDQFLDERGREFTWELVRRRDLIRFGKYEKGDIEYVTQDNEGYRWFPIPYSVLEKSPRRDDGSRYWTQNQAYVK